MFVFVGVDAFVDPRADVGVIPYQMADITHRSPPKLEGLLYYIHCFGGGIADEGYLGDIYRIPNQSDGCVMNNL